MGILDEGDTCLLGSGFEKVHLRIELYIKAVANLNLAIESYMLYVGGNIS